MPPAAIHFIYRLHPSRPGMLTTGPTAEESAIVAEHFQYLKRACDAGAVVLFGRTQTADERTFGICIFRAESEDAARRFMESDPAVLQGVMRAELFPFRIAGFNSAGAAG
jgi:uncharacterized protein YciI